MSIHLHQTSQQSQCGRVSFAVKKPPIWLLSLCASTNVLSCYGSSCVAACTLCACYNNMLLYAFVAAAFSMTLTHSMLWMWAHQISHKVAQVQLLQQISESRHSSQKSDIVKQWFADQCCTTADRLCLCCPAVQLWSWTASHITADAAVLTVCFVISWPQWPKGTVLHSWQ